MQRSHGPAQRLHLRGAGAEQPPVPRSLRAGAEHGLAAPGAGRAAGPGPAQRAAPRAVLPPAGAARAHPGGSAAARRRWLPPPGPTGRVTESQPIPPSGNRHRRPRLLPGAPRERRDAARPPPVRNATSRETRRGRAASRRHRRLPVRLEGSRFGQGSPPSPRVPVHDLRSRLPRRVPAAPRTAGPGWGQPEVKVKIGVTIRVGVGASAPLAAGPRPELAGEGPVAQPCIARVLAWLHPAAGTQWGTQKCRCPHRPHCARPKVQSRTETHVGRRQRWPRGQLLGGLLPPAATWGDPAPIVRAQRCRRGPGAPGAPGAPPVWPTNSVCPACRERCASDGTPLLGAKAKELRLIGIRRRATTSGGSSEFPAPGM